jgi:hypothetical protein
LTPLKELNMVETQLNALRPTVFQGIDLARYRTDPISVSTVNRFYRDLTGAPWPPQSAREWADANENVLCQAQAGRVFCDPSGRLEERKRAFESATYPDPIWKWRIASSLFQLWHYGDYNLRDRLLKRRAAPMLGHRTPGLSEFVDRRHLGPRAGKMPAVHA